MSVDTARFPRILVGFDILLIDPDPLSSTAVLALLRDHSANVTLADSVDVALLHVQQHDLTPTLIMVGAAICAEDSARLLGALRDRLAIPAQALPALAFTRANVNPNSSEACILYSYQARVTIGASDAEIIGAIIRVCVDAKEEKVREDLIASYTPSKFSPAAGLSS